MLAQLKKAPQEEGRRKKEEGKKKKSNLMNINQMDNRHLQCRVHNRHQYHYKVNILYYCIDTVM